MNKQCDENQFKKQWAQSSETNLFFFLFGFISKSLIHLFLLGRWQSYANT